MEAWHECIMVNPALAITHRSCHGYIVYILYVQSTGIFSVVFWVIFVCELCQ